MTSAQEGKYGSLSDEEAVRVLTQRIEQAKSILTEIRDALKSAAGGD